MKKIIVLAFLFFGSLAAMNAQENKSLFDYNKDFTKQRLQVKKLNDDSFVLVNGDDRRYVADNLPDEYKIDGLSVIVSGKEATIPPYVRMMGAPVHLEYAKAKKPKKFNIQQKVYTF